MQILVQMRRALSSAGIAVLACILAFGQALTFEVASVKPSPPIPSGGGVYFGPLRGGPGTADPGHITWTYATLKNLLMTAYDVKNYQVSGPGWLNTERYDIIVKVPADTTKEQVRVMWQNLLAERFGVRVHHESKELPVYELVAGKGGSKLKESVDDPNTALAQGPPKITNGELMGPGMVHMIHPSSAGPIMQTQAKAQPISQLTTMLGNQLGRPVLDKTGLTGKYDFKMEFTADLGGMPPPPAAGAPAQASDPGTNLATAVQQQLGLRLVSSKADIDIIVVDKVEKTPTEN